MSRSHARTPETPRELMELAVAVMAKSVAEPRPDNKASPSVGAVVSMPDGTIHEASRGELRHGDHAEFTLLERKNRSTRFDGARLFTTLEPCAPGARTGPKISCAERIVLARITEVWVGIEDPDPEVDRKGIRYLQDHDVDVHMFDPDLQDQIRDQNQEFLEQALDRAAAAERVAEPIILSFLEDTAADYVFSDFAPQALEKYRERAAIEDPVDSAEFRQRLLRQGLLERDDGLFRATGMGLLLFGKQPRDFMPQAGLLGTIRLSGNAEIIHDFDGPLVLIPENVEEWLKAHLPESLDRAGMRRRSTFRFPFVLAREAIVNALIHRDYDIEGAKCHLIVSDDAIDVHSPGMPIKPITLAEIQNFEAPVLSRNPRLHYVFNRMGLAEERGLGMKTFEGTPEKYGLPRPVYRYENPYLKLKLFRSSEAAVSELPPSTLASLSQEERAGWQFLSSRASTSKAEYSLQLGVSTRTAVRHLNHLIELGLLSRKGSGPSTIYVTMR